MYLYRMNQSMFIALILIVACSMGEMFHGTQAQAAPLKKETQSRLVPDVDLGASVFGVVLGSFIDEPSEVDKVVNGFSIPYGGFGGVGGGAGLSMMALWKGIIGIEVGYQYLSENAEGRIAFATGKVTIDVEQSAHHIPVLLKLTLPVPGSLSFVGGPEFVSVGSSSVSSQFGKSEGLHDGYTAWRFGLGFEFPLPSKGIDLRIPLNLQGVYNPDLGDTVADRIALNDLNPSLLNLIRYRTEWQWQAMVTLGLSAHF